MSSRDSVILLSDSEDEERCLKIYYRGFQDCIEVPMEANGNVLFEDITLLDPKISALFLEKDSLKKLVKPRDGYFKEPKTKWRNFKVFAVLKKESEIILNGNSSDLNHDVTYNWNMQIKTETPTTSGSLQTCFEPDNPIAFPSPSNRITSIKSEPPTTSELIGNNNHEFEHPSFSNSPSIAEVNDCKTQPEVLKTLIKDNNDSVHSSLSTSPPNHELTSIKPHVPIMAIRNNNHKPGHPTPSSSRMLTRSQAQMLPRSQAKLSKILPTFNSLPSLNTVDFIYKSDNCIVAVNEPTHVQLCSVYNVSSLKSLKFMLCRGNLGHNNNDFVAFRKRLKRTLFAYPNKETVRLFHYARTSDILLKTLDSNAKDYCELCDCSLTLRHLLSEKHLTVYHQKYNADPPEIPNLFNPEIYKQYIDPSILAGLKISEFKEMEDSPEFSINSQNKHAVQYKYVLINRILQYNLEMSYKSTFSVEKLMFLQKNANNRIFQEIFTIKNFKCCKKTINGQVSFICHIFSRPHIQKGLNQEQFDSICKSMSFVKKTSNGFCFLPFTEMDRKRKQSSDVVQEDSKRQKQEKQ